MPRGSQEKRNLEEEGEEVVEEEEEEEHHLTTSQTPLLQYWPGRKVMQIGILQPLVDHRVLMMITTETNTGEIFSSCFMQDVEL